ncbi:MAG: alpha/beta fold hydrolase [Clostridia bacterium]|nr:alpha/beta fold hydrolase [Clostridia bacterium]
MKAIRRSIAVLLASVLVLTGIGSFAEDVQEARRMETCADAEFWVSVLLGDAPETLWDSWQMTDQMRMSLALSGGMKALAESIAALGAASHVGPAWEDTIQGYRAFHVPCAFQAMPLDLILVTEDGVIAGLNTGAYSGGTDEPADTGCESIDLVLPVPSMNGELPGTLTLPEGDGPFPAVVLVHGSGPNDRDETIANLKPFRDLAEGLASMGVAVYRYDKRTYVYGTQMISDRHVTLADETIDDAAAAVQLLARQERIDPERIFVLGHSLGGNAVPAIAQVLAEMPVDARGYIMMAASPRPLDVLMREQIDWLYSLLPVVTAEQQAEKDQLLADLDRLADVDALAEDDVIAGAYAPYWQWLAAYDALGAASGITAPCLLLQGEEDYQVTMTDYAIWQDALGDRDNWQFVSFPGLTHPFTPGLKSEGSAAYARTEKVSDEVIRTVADFILAH